MKKKSKKKHKKSGKKTPQLRLLHNHILSSGHFRPTAAEAKLALRELLDEIHHFCCHLVDDQINDDKFQHQVGFILTAMLIMGDDGHETLKETEEIMTSILKSKKEFNP